MQQNHSPQSATFAVIEMASNSVTLVVARRTADQLVFIKEESIKVALRESVKETGEIIPGRRDEVLAAMREFQELAQQCSVGHILVVANKAVREARNRERFIEEIWRETGLQINLLNGTLAAALAFQGAIYNPDIPANVGVLDVGPGSMELITAQMRRITWLISVPLSSSWLHNRYLPSTPPTHGEVQQARSFLHDYMHHLHIPERPSALIGTGSSPKSLLKFAIRALQLDQDSDSLTKEGLVACLDRLTVLPAEELARQYEQTLERARVLTGGTLIIQEVMNFLHLDTLRVSSLGLPQGVLLAYARHGDNWLAHPEIKIDPSVMGNAPPL